MLKGKKIILGITASIAAYKAAMIIRLLVKEGAVVKVIMTPMAKEFVTPLTLSVLSGNPVLIDFFSVDDGTWNSHVDLGKWADIIVIAPLTACTMGKMANGIADNLLTATYLSARCPVMLAPAMDHDMFNHPSTKKNIEILRSYGNVIIEPAVGELASGLSGKGRMEEPDTIVKMVSSLLTGRKTIPSKKKGLNGRKILITAGPTQEYIDPVRYISNRSTGKMGFALAESCAARNADVILVSGQVNIHMNHPRIRIIRVISAGEMYVECMRLFPECDAAIMSAAVSDFTPVAKTQEKIKKTGSKISLELVPTKDIAASLGKIKNDNQVLVGFALESDNEIRNAIRKIPQKKLDFIILNSLRDEGAGFGMDTNKITIIDKDNKIKKFKLKPKEKVAEDIVDELEGCFNFKRRD